MGRKKLLKIALIVSSLSLVVSSLAGCGDSEANKPKTQREQTIVYNLAVDPKSIDPAKNNAVDGATVLSNAFEGLMRIDNNDKIVNGVAEKYEMSKDGLSYTFTLRKDAKWSDGKAVTAQDFEYAWKRALKKETAAEYAYQLYYIKNGQKYNKSQVTEDQVGVKAENDTTLKVTLESPTSYFLDLMAFPTYFPVRKDVVEKAPDTWATTPETYICNGPFKMSEWKAKDSLTFVKNENYWDAKSVKLNKVVYKMIVDANTYLSAFKTGDLDFIETPPNQETPQLLKDKIAEIAPNLGTYFYVINMTDKAKQLDPEAAKALQDVKVRKALTNAIDRKVLVESVTKGGQTPAKSFVPKGIPDANGKAFAEKEYFKPTGDIELAKKLLAEAGYPDGKNFPKITFVYNDNELHQKVAQAVQDMWKKNLNINIELKKEEWKVFQVTRTDKNYLMARHGWLGDYVDPMTFLDIFETESGNNDAGYSNKEYDKYIELAKKEVDPTKRSEYLHKAEDILMEDMPIIPMYYYTNVLCIKDYVKNVHKSPLGFVFFRDAYIQN